MVVSSESRSRTFSLLLKAAWKTEFCPSGNLRSRHISCMRQVLQKGDPVGAGKRARLIQNAPAGRGCGSPSPGGKELGADAKSEQPVCEEAVEFTLGGLQELKLLTLFASISMLR